jgi:hypothetical protein
MTTQENKETTTVKHAIDYTLDQIGRKIRKRQDLRYDGQTMLRSRQCIDELEAIVNREFTNFYHYLMFKKFHVLSYQVVKLVSCQDTTPAAKISVTFVWKQSSRDQLPVTLTWEYDWINEFDVSNIKRNA